MTIGNEVKQIVQKVVVDDVSTAPVPISPAPVPEQSPQVVVAQETKEIVIPPSQVLTPLAPQTPPAPQTVTAPQIVAPTDTTVSTVSSISPSVVSSPDQTL